MTTYDPDAKDDCGTDSQPVATAPEPDDRPDFDGLLDCLNCERRRIIIDVVDHRGPSTLREVAEDVADAETDADEPETGAYKRVRIGLYQNHAPKLDRAGVIDWNGTGDNVSPGPAFEIAKAMLHASRRAYTATVRTGVEARGPAHTDGGEER